MKLEFESIKDLLGFIKLALYMTDKRAAKKVLKWKKSKELIVGDTYTLNLSNKSSFDEAFITSIKTKYKIWIRTNKMSTIDQLNNL